VTLAEEQGHIMKIMRTRLRFQAELEHEFREDYYYRSIFTVRVALVLGIILYSAFGILDYFIVPENRFALWFIRFAVVVPVLFITLLITGTAFFRKAMQAILAFVSLMAGYGIVAMIAITAREVGSVYYYAGLMLVMMWTYTFIKLRSFYATIVCWSILMGYEVTAVFLQGLTETTELLSIFINNNFFFISSNIIGMFACYLIELFTRKDFLQRREIAANREELKTERNELKEHIDIMNMQLEMARIIQQRFIPAESPLENISFLYRPMEAIGGDLIDFIHFDDNERIGIFLSDVSGHGVPAALVTSMIKSSILESRKISSNPAKLLHHINDILTGNIEDNYVTAFLLYF
jgi:hypothetical protein